MIISFLKLGNRHFEMEAKPGPNYKWILNFWIEMGDFEYTNDEEGAQNEYVITKSVEHHLQNIARAVLIKKYPILLQGPTSSGKTSMVEYLARQTNHRFIRINNHDHTDLSEYFGSYISNEKGELVFQEGNSLNFF